MLAGGRIEHSGEQSQLSVRKQFVGQPKRERFGWKQRKKQSLGFRRNRGRGCWRLHAWWGKPIGTERVGRPHAGSAPVA
jgi:hypothetical protein